MARRARAPGPEAPAVTRAWVALGSNQGRRLENLLEAARRLSRLGPVRLGPVVDTEAWLPEEDPTPQPRYLNSVVEVDTALDAVALFGACKRIEREMGRRPAPRWAPRLIDCDLLLFGDAVLRTPELEVPHPRLAQRRFVLEPLVALAPDAVHPVLGRSVRALWRALR